MADPFSGLDPAAHGYDPAKDPSPAPPAFKKRKSDAGPSNPVISDSVVQQSLRGIQAALDQDELVNEDIQQDFRKNPHKRARDFIPASAYSEVEHLEATGDIQRQLDYQKRVREAMEKWNSMPEVLFLKGINSRLNGAAIQATNISDEIIFSRNSAILNPQPIVGHPQTLGRDVQTRAIGELTTTVNPELQRVGAIMDMPQVTGVQTLDDEISAGVLSAITELSTMSAVFAGKTYRHFLRNTAAMNYLQDLTVAVVTEWRMANAKQYYSTAAQRKNPRRVTQLLRTMESSLIFDRRLGGFRNRTPVEMQTKRFEDEQQLRQISFGGALY